MHYLSVVHVNEVKLLKVETIFGLASSLLSLKLLKVEVETTFGLASSFLSIN